MKKCQLPQGMKLPGALGGGSLPGLPGFPGAPRGFGGLPGLPGKKK